MKNTRGLCWIGAGIVLLLAALSLVLFNWRQDRSSGEITQAYLEELQSQLPEVPTETRTTELTGEDILALYQNQAETQTEPVQETVIALDDQDFLGIISIPELEIELPVLYGWSYPNLKIAPCRYSGAVQSGDLILAAHNYRSHFGRIQELNTGSVIYFTECSGVLHTYEVVQSELIAGRDVPAMDVGADEWDLTLFTCTLSGVNRVTVRAVETK